jgi:hypothetical protein
MRGFFNRRTLALLAAVVTLCGCTVIVRPPPPVQRVYVVREPPAERVEVIVAQPSPAHVWIAGHWGWQREDFVWIAGRWERPAPQFHEWVRGHWEREPRGWFYIEGHWR